ncbi:MAG TPA: hypothetical protein VFH77_09305, partial [Streptomyces sp.]|nr:hypothetical protein [Streptomyces sp.]
AAEQHRRRQQAYGRWQPYVDAQPARNHVRALMQYGLGWQRIARLAGVSTGALSKLLYGTTQRGPSKQIRSETAQKLLALRPDPRLLADTADVDGTGTRRRIRALVAAGWPQCQLADRLGMGRGNFGTFLAGGGLVQVSTARSVRRLYDELWRADPAGHGVTAQAVSRARYHARRSGWAPVGAWDDDLIDDPAAYPDWTGQCGTPLGYHAHQRHQILPVCDPCKAARAAARKAVAA